MDKSLPHIVAFSGPIGCGKSTAAKYLAERHGYRQIKFANPIKDMLRAIGLSEKELEGGFKESTCPLLSGATPRRAMQTLGTEWGRALHPDFWVNLWMIEADKHRRVVVDDCRFRNESMAIHACGGILIRMVKKSSFSPIDNHASETQDLPYDSIIRNVFDIGTLHSLIDRAVTGEPK